MSTIVKHFSALEEENFTSSANQLGCTDAPRIVSNLIVVVCLQTFTCRQKHISLECTAGTVDGQRYTSLER